MVCGVDADRTCPLFRGLVGDDGRGDKVPVCASSSSRIMECDGGPTAKISGLADAFVRLATSVFTGEEDDEEDLGGAGAPKIQKSWIRDLLAKVSVVIKTNP